MFSRFWNITIWPLFKTKMLIYHSRANQTPLRDLGIRVSKTYFNGLRAPKDKIAVPEGSIVCSSGLQGLYFLKYEEIAMGNVLAPGLQAFKMMGSRAPATLPPLGAMLMPTCEIHVW